jgi:mycothiol synthase
MTWLTSISAPDAMTAVLNDPELPQGSSHRPLTAADLADLRAAGATTSSLEAARTAELAMELEDAVGGKAPSVACCVRSGAALVAVAAAVVTPRVRHQHRTCLSVWVAPASRGRGLGRALLAWAEAEGRRLIAALPGDVPAVLRVDLLTPGAAETRLVEGAGFQPWVAEWELRRDLVAPLPDAPLPDGIELLPWSPERRSAFHAAYSRSFEDRTGFSGWDEWTWAIAFTGCRDFLPEVSFLAVNAGEPVGFLVSHENEEEDARLGWVAQVGVVPAWRRRGLGRALVVEALRRYRERGWDAAGIEVNVNNPGALALYEAIGFERRYCRAAYVKEP